MSKSGTLFRSGNLRTQGQQKNLLLGAQRDVLWEVYHLEKCGKIQGRVGRQNSRAAIGRFCRCQVGLSEYLAECRRIEGQNARVDTKEGLFAQHFDITVLEVERVMRSYGRRVYGGFVVRGVPNREIGQAGYTNGRGLNHRGVRNFFGLRHGFIFWGRRLDDLGFRIRVPR